MCVLDSEFVTCSLELELSCNNGHKTSFVVAAAVVFVVVLFCS